MVRWTSCRATYSSIDDLPAHVDVVWIQDSFVVSLQDGPDVLSVGICQANGNLRPLPLLGDGFESALLLHESVKRVQVQLLSLHHGDLQRAALQLPEFGDLIEKVQLDACLRLEDRVLELTK